MAFQTALSGLNAASGGLDVTGNNIANSSTTGFKKSRAEFADVYAVSFGGVSDTATGSGVRLAKVSQQFTQGNVDFTDNNLDLAISGEGFFALNDNGSDLYSRAGNFRVDREGYVVNAHGHKLQKYEVDDDGAVTNFTPEDMQLNLGANPASETENVDLNVNLDANSELDTPKPLDPDDPDSYNFSTTTTVYDSLGVTHDASLYFQKAPATSRIELSGEVDSGAGNTTGPITTTLYDSTGKDYPNAKIRFTEDGGAGTYTVEIDPNNDGTWVAGDASWDPSTGGEVKFTGFDVSESGGVDAAPADLTLDVSAVTTGAAPVDGLSVDDTTNAGPAGEWYTRLEVDGQDMGTETLNFKNDGSLDTSVNPDGSERTFGGTFSPANADSMNITVDFAGSTQFGASSTVNQLVQDGYTTGRLSGINIDSSGIVFARYTNGQSETLGAVAMAKFANPNGLQKVGDSNWAASFESGDVQRGQAGTGTFGQIQSGALEASNVDISKQLVNMIIAQRDFQANAKMISTEDQVTQTIINIR